MVFADFEAKVASILREAADLAVLPRFRRLLEDDVEEKEPGELVTIADRESEAHIASRLLNLLPGSTVVGEEATAAAPHLLNTLNAGYVWLVDPLDGTSNFVAGRSEFAILVALLSGGITVASWLYVPVADRMHVAARGAGAFVDGARLSISSTAAMSAARRRGAIFTRFLPDQLKARVEQATPALGEILPGTKCAGFEYPNIATGVQSFVLYWRLLPWDHAAGIQFLEEAGGYTRHLDGARYSPVETRTGLLAACNEAEWTELHQLLVG